MFNYAYYLLNKNISLVFNNLELISSYSSVSMEKIIFDFNLKPK